MSQASCPRRTSLISIVNSLLLSFINPRGVLNGTGSSALPICGNELAVGTGVMVGAIIGVGVGKYWVAIETYVLDGMAALVVMVGF